MVQEWRIGGVKESRSRRMVGDEAGLERTVNFGT